MTVSTTSKYTLKFTAYRDSTESLARSVSGLNFPTPGPSRDGAITNILTKMDMFTTGHLNNIRLVTEQEVIQ